MPAPLRGAMLLKDGSDQMKIGIIGAGPAGLTAAYQLSKQRVAVDLYEASDSVGGLARSIRLWGQTVDLGPHRFFSQDRRVNSLWLEVVGTHYAMVDRLTRILYGGKYFSYPLRPVEALRKLGPLEAMRCAVSYAREQVAPTTQDGSFEAWVCQRFGRRLFEIFFKTYSEKLWGIPCDQLDADFAAQRIRQFSLGAAIKSALSSGSRHHRTLVDQFAYPTGGTGMVYDRMARHFRSRGGRLFLNTPVRRVLTNDGRATGLELMDGATREYDHLISSMPLTALVARLPEIPSRIAQCARNLRFRNTILVYLEVAKECVFSDNWIYIHSPDLMTGRITNYSNWGPGTRGDSRNTILSMEYWCNDDDALWSEPDDALIKLGVKELRRTGLIADESAIANGAVYRIAKCYPVYHSTYRENLRPIEQYLTGIEGLQAIGRYGSFKYNNQDHSILMGMLAATNVLTGSGHDLWGVNSDYDHYQEACRITETGLVNA